MKKIFFLTLIFSIINFSAINSQNINYLSLNEFYNEICFDNICLNEIIDTQSNLGDIQTLFSLPVEKVIDDNTNNSVGYKIEGYYFDFEESTTLDNKIDYNIAYIWVNESSKVKIKNSLIGIGDNINKLGDVKILKSGKILFLNSDTNASVKILYVNNIITEISFVFD